MMNDREKLFALVEKIANFLPEQWRFNYLVDQGKKFENPRILGLKGASICFRYRCDKENMISVTGMWPSIPGESYYRSVDHWGVMTKEDHYPAINFSMTRKISAIAKDIEVRFLANYWKLYQRCLVERERMIKHRELVDFQVEVIKRIHPVKQISHNYNPDRPRLYIPSKSHLGGGEIYFNSRDKYDLKLGDLSLDEIVKILSVLNQREEKGA